MRQNVASQVVGAQMVSATDGSAFTGSVTASVTGDGGTQGTGSVGSGACVHEGNGFHTYAPAQAETNFAHVAFTFTGTGAIPVTVQIYTSFPQTGDSFARIGAAGAGLTAIDLPNQTMDITGNITGNLSGSVGSVTGAVGSVTGAVGSVTGAVGSVTGAVGSVTGNVGGTVNGLTATAQGNVRTAVGLANADLDTQLAALPTAGENADAVWTEAIADHSGGAGSTAEALDDAGGAGTPPTVEEIRQEIDSNSTQLAAIVADTNELETDWSDGGRLDLILDARASQTSVNTIDDFLDTEIGDLPTNAELTAALASADDAVLAAIAALNDFDPATETVSLATGGITATTIADNAIDAAALATDAVEEIRNAIAAITVTELTGLPAASPTLIGALALLYMAVRNRRDTTATSDEIHNAAGTPVLQCTLSDDTTVFTKSILEEP